MSDVLAPDYMKVPDTAEEWLKLIKCNFGVTYSKKTLQIIPMVFVADDTFPLTTYSMKPYSHNSCSDEQRIFDCRLLRVRRISENGFGVWMNRFRLFAKKELLTPEKEETAVLASQTLHHCKILVEEGYI